MGTQVFLIGHSPEEVEVAKRLHDSLSGLGLSAHPAQDLLRAREVDTEAVGEAISSCDLFVLLWSESAARSSRVELEWATALAMNKTIIPCLLDATPLPGALRSIDAVSMRDFRQGIVQIGARLGASGERGSAPARSADMEDIGTIITTTRAPGTPVKPTPRSGPQTLMGTGTDLTGRQLGTRYRILRLLGRGGMGAVYHAHDDELEREVALKVIRADITEDPAVLQRFKREILLSSVVTHRNVLRVYDLGELEGLKFLTMQFVDGEDLAGLFKREGCLPLPRVLSIFRQMCQGLAAAHERGILHRDLKPSNIMIDRDDVVYLTDFGLARSLTGSSLTQSGTLMGTPDYMSPEQVKGEALDVRSDIYSLGIILYQMVTNHVPYSGDTAYEIMIQRVQKPPRPAKELNPEIPRFLEQIIDRCMTIDKMARYESVNELLIDLEQGVDKGRTVLSTKFAMRRWRGVAAAVTWRKLAFGLPLVLLVLVGTWWLWNRGNAPPVSQVHKPVAVLIADFQNRTGDASFDGALEQILDTSLEGASFITTFNRGQARQIGGQLKQGATVLDLALAQLVATREGINVVVDGSIASTGRGYEIAVKAVDALNGSTLSEQNARISRKEEVSGALGRLSARIRRTLGDTTPESVQTAAAETFTAASLEAAKTYAAAQELQGTGQWEKAIPVYKQAIALDANLGRAYAGLAVMYRNLSNRQEAEKYYSQAMEHIDRMSERESLRTKGGYFVTIGNNAKAAEEFSTLVQKYPADFVGHSNLALANFMSRNMAQALEEGKRATEIYPKNIVMRSNLALYAVYAGDFEAATREAEEILKVDRSYGSVYLCLALSQLAQGRTEQAADAYRRLAELDAQNASLAATGMADLALYAGKDADAEAILRKGIAADRAAKQNFAAARKATSLAFALMNLGQKAQALAEADQAAAESAMPSVQYEAGLIYLRAKEEQKALKLASTLGLQIQLEPQIYGKLIQGEALLQRGNTWEAIKVFHEAQKLADTWLGRFGLGRAYLAASAFTEAYDEFEQCLKRRGEATAVFLDDIPTLRYLPSVYYYLGVSQHGLKSPAAADSFRTYLKIKEKAAQDPLAADAKRRLGGS